MMRKAFLVCVLAAMAFVALHVGCSVPTNLDAGLGTSTSSTSEETTYESEPVPAAVAAATADNSTTEIDVNKTKLTVKRSGNYTAVTRGPSASGTGVKELKTSAPVTANTPGASSQAPPSESKAQPPKPLNGLSLLFYALGVLCLLAAGVVWYWFEDKFSNSWKATLGLAGAGVGFLLLGWFFESLGFAAFIIAALIVGTVGYLVWKGIIKIDKIPIAPV